MKVALLLTGHLRMHYSIADSIKTHLLDTYDTNVYISTWSVNNYGRIKGDGWQHPEPVELDTLLALYPNSKIHIEDHEFFYKNRFEPIKSEFFTESVDDLTKRPFWMERARDQSYIIKKGWELINNPAQYDLIIKLRLDLRLKKLNLINEGKLVLHSRTPDRYTDWAAYGPPNLMEHYCLWFDRLSAALKEDSDNNTWMPHEQMLFNYINEYGIEPIIDTEGFDFNFGWQSPGENI
jgi:hypothetical protein